MNACKCGHNLGEHRPDPNRPFAWPCAVCDCDEYDEREELPGAVDIANQIAAGRQVMGENGEPKVAMTTCGTCGRTWDDARITSFTPTPAGRCPFEAFHELQSEEN